MHLIITQALNAPELQHPRIFLVVSKSGSTQAMQRMWPKHQVLIHFTLQTHVSGHGGDSKYTLDFADFANASWTAYAKQLMHTCTGIFLLHLDFPV